MADNKHGTRQKATGDAAAAASASASAAAEAPVMTEADRRQVRILTAVVVGLGVLLLVGLAVLLAVVIMRAAGKPAAPAAAEMTLPVPRGTVVEDMTLDGNMLAVRLLHPAGREIVVLDARKGRVLRRLRLVEQAAQ